MFKGIKPILYAGREVLPLIEGGKGVAATNHLSSGAWAAAGGIGTISAVNADSYDPEGRIIPQIYHALTRREATPTSAPTPTARLPPAATDTEPAAPIRSSTLSASTTTSASDWT